MFAKPMTSSHSCGQAMVESVLALFFTLVIFFLLFDFLEAMRAKIYVEYAAAKCARARTVGLNDFMLRKIARLDTMPVDGKCLTTTEGGLPISQNNRIALIGQYLASEYEEQADGILDFETWRDNQTKVNVSDNGSVIEVTVSHQHPLIFGLDLGRLLGSDLISSLTTIKGNAKVEPHYQLYLQ